MQKINVIELLQKYSLFKGDDFPFYQFKNQEGDVVATGNTFSRALDDLIQSEFAK